MNHYLICIIPFSKKDLANKDADKVNRGKTGKTFTVGLSPDGKLPITHYWFCWWISDEESIKLKEDFSGTPDVDGIKHQSRVFDLRDGWTAESILEKMHLKTYDVILPITKK